MAARRDPSSRVHRPARLLRLPLRLLRLLLRLRLRLRLCLCLCSCLGRQVL